MSPVISSVLTSKKPFDAHEWLADTDARAAFNDELKNHLVKVISQQIGQQVGHVRHHLELYWSKNLNQQDDDYSWGFEEELTAEQQEWADQDDLLDVLKKIVITVEGIHFPAIDTAEPKEDYQSLFSMIKRLHFIDCHFYDEQVFLEQLIGHDHFKICYTSCVFHNAWHVTEGYAVESNLPLFDECEFKHEVSIVDRKSVLLASRGYPSAFKNCSLQQVSIKNATIEVKLFDFSREIPAKLKSLKLENCTFDAKLALANIVGIETLEFSSTVFNKKFALIACHCDKAVIKDTNFKGLADFYSSQFGQFQLQKSIFADFAGFEKCHFGTEQAEKIEAIILKYVTFYSFINFRDAVFNQPLDLRNSNRKEQPNFLDAKFIDTAAKSTDRETFRIIKHSFDAVGNHIEANKYFAHEMQAYRRELRKEANEGVVGHWRERLLLLVNAVVSKHGQDYWRASAWFFAVIGIIALVLANDKYKWCIASAPIQRGLYFFGDALNGFALGFLPLGAVFEGKEHLAFFLFFATLALSGITWHLLVAIRRHSKR